VSFFLFSLVVFSGGVPMVCPWPFMASLDDSAQKPSDSGRSFAQMLSDPGDSQLQQLPPRVVMGDTVRVKITQKDYESGISDCRLNLHGRITFGKGNGFFEFKFGSIEDMRKIWALGVVDLRPGILRFFSWTKSFKPNNHVQTLA
jgi:hypothetical protein